MASTSTTGPAHQNAGASGPIVRAQIEAVAAHPGCRIEDQAAARRWLAGTNGTHAHQYPHLAWTPAIEQRCREQCARAFLRLLGVGPSTAATRQVDRCTDCGTVVEADAVASDARSPCCGAVIEPFTQRGAAEVLGVRQVTPATLTADQIDAVHRALANSSITDLTSRQRVLLAACERLSPAGLTEATCMALRLDELGAVSEMTLDGCRALIAAIWNSATPRLRVAA